MLRVARATNPRKRQQGSIDELPSGALRVRVYAGTDPITRKRHNLVEVIPPGPKAWDQADAVRRRFLDDIQQRRSPRTTATVDQLLDRYLDQHQGGKSTVTGYREYVDKHVRPSIGKRKVGDLDADGIAQGSVDSWPVRTWSSLEGSASCPSRSRGSSGTT